MKEEHIKELQKTIAGLTVDNNSLRKTLKYRLRDIDTNHVEIASLKGKLEEQGMLFKVHRKALTGIHERLIAAKQTITRRNTQIADLRGQVKKLVKKVNQYQLTDGVI